MYRPRADSSGGGPETGPREILIASPTEGHKHRRTIYGPICMRGPISISHNASMSAPRHLPGWVEGARGPGAQVEASPRCGNGHSVIWARHRHLTSTYAHGRALCGNARRPPLARSDGILEQIGGVWCRNGPL